MVPLLPLPPLRVTADVTNTTLTNAHATTHTAANGGGRATSLASLQRFWAVAVSVNSSYAPRGPRSLSRLSLKIRFKCANSICTLFRLRLDYSKECALEMARSSSLTNYLTLGCSI